MLDVRRAWVALPPSPELPRAPPAPTGPTGDMGQYPPDPARNTSEGEPPPVTAEHASGPGDLGVAAREDWRRAAGAEGRGSGDRGHGEVEAILREHDRNPDWEDLEALHYWVRAWAVGGPSGPAGDTLHRWGSTSEV